MIGQMMEKVVRPAQKPRRTEEEVIAQCPWAATGKAKGRKPNIITSLEPVSYTHLVFLFVVQ